MRFSGKCRSVITSRGFRIILAAVLLYILDAWILGSTALFLTDIKKGLYYYKHPLEAAVNVPVHASLAIWLILNLLVFLVIGMAAGFLFIRFPELSNKVFRKKVEYTDDPTCGTAKWMEPHEVSKILEFGHGPGILFGTYENAPVRLYQKSRLNRNVVVFGPPGSGKTWSEVLPNVLQAVTNSESIIIIDPKSEIAKATLKFFQKRGYNVKVFNLVDMLISDRWNPLDSVTNDIDAQLFTEVVIANTAVPGIKKMGGDPFWDRAEQNLLKALTLYVKMEYPKEKQNIHSIYSLLAAGDMNNLDITFNNLDEDHPAKAPYNIYSQAAGTVKGGVIQGLGTRLQVFANEQVRKLTEVSDIDLEAPGKELCAFYCVVSDTDSTFDFLSSLFFSFLFIRLTKLGDKSPGGSCPVKVNFMLDEFCNIGAIPDFKKRIATMRSRGISCTIITQSLPQLENRYPSNAWQEIISCCDSRLFLGVNDNHTAK
ncbi:MAG: type IV secretory system conjugative DNA transfer family protein, partial [Peptococcaceae bacterium]|nr:type IV secretory system conjugative DNA transfer family protein [Peptococcaceae bacterium]